MKSRLLYLFLGPASFLAMAFFYPELDPPVRYAAGITLWMSVWWISESVPFAVTALLPLVLFPLCGILKLKDVSATYGSEVVFLFLSGFLFGRAIERWNLHRRIALRMIGWFGRNPRGVVLGFMAATAFISMWISNTATAVMMTPVAIAVASPGNLGASDDRRMLNFQRALMLGIAYACSIGGMATIVGTPTNAIFVGYVEEKMQFSISFWEWFQFAFPLSLALLFLCWLMLMWMFPTRKDALAAHDEDFRLASEREMMPFSVPEKRLIALFGMVILSWLSGGLLWYKYLPPVNDTLVAIIGAILLFLIPSGAKPTAEGETLMDWPAAMGIPWGVLIFFGGGLALAKGFEDSGLAAWIGNWMNGLSNLPAALTLLVILIIVVILSEIASNIATISIMLPILAALSGVIGADTLGLLFSAGLAASIGFGLPIATAPNTIVFSAGYLRVRDMTKAGFLLDMIAILLLMAFIYTLLPVFWGINL